MTFADALQAISLPVPPRQLEAECSSCGGQGIQHVRHHLDPSPRHIPCPNRRCEGGMVKLYCVVCDEPATVLDEHAGPMCADCKTDGDFVDSAVLTPMEMAAVEQFEESHAAGLRGVMLAYWDLVLT